MKTTVPAAEISPVIFVPSEKVMEQVPASSSQEVVELPALVSALNVDIRNTLVYIISHVGEVRF